MRDRTGALTDDGIGDPWLDTGYFTYPRYICQAEPVTTHGYQLAHALAFLDQVADSHQVCWHISHDGHSYVAGVLTEDGRFDYEDPSFMRAASLHGIAFALAEYIREGDY